MEASSILNKSLTIGVASIERPILDGTAIIMENFSAILIFLCTLLISLAAICFDILGISEDDKELDIAIGRFVSKIYVPEYSPYSPAASSAIFSGVFCANFPKNSIALVKTPTSIRLFILYTAVAKITGSTVKTKLRVILL